MKRSICMALFALLLAGCETESMMSTPFYTGGGAAYAGGSGDRVNLWPLVYWSDPVGSVAWPMFSFSDDHFAFRPLYSQWKRGGEWSEFNVLWPICQFDTHDDDYRVFPFFWGDDYFHVFPVFWNFDDYHTLFPIVWYKEGESFNIFPILFMNWRKGCFTLFPIYWQGPHYVNLFPLFYHDADTTMVTPFFGWSRNGDSWLFPLYSWGHDGTLLTPIYGQSGDSRWLFPVFYNDVDDFASLLICRFNSGSPEASWFIPPLLTSWREGGFASPLWIRDRDQNFIPPLLTAWSDDGFASPLWMHDRDRNFIPWLLSGYSDHGREGSCLLGLGGWSNGTSWAFPLYYRNGKNGDIRTLLAGRITDRENVYSWWLTPLLGTKSGDVSGGWFFPLVNVSRDPEFAELEKLMYADTLDASVKGAYCDRERRVSEGYCVTNKVLSVGGRSASNGTSFLLGLCGFERELRQINNEENRLGWRDPVQEMAGDMRNWTEEPGKTVSFTDTADLGNIFLFKRTSERAVSFDYDTREKIFEGRVSSTGILCHLLWHSKREVVEGGHDYSDSSILWRLWHRESLDGDTTTDIFPFVTIDNKKNGFTRTSFLWRFFRYENDPVYGTKVDFLFLPVWR